MALPTLKIRYTLYLVDNRMKKACFLFLVCLATLSVAQAQNQFPSQIWHKGSLVLTDGTAYSGLLKYDLVTNLLQLQNETVITFTASNVSSFDIYDETYGGIRKFYSLPYALNGDYQTPVFFEILTQGEHIALLCREYIATDSRGMNSWGTMGMNPFWGPQNMTGFRLAFTYYFLKNGGLEKYSGKKNELFDMLPGFDEELQLYMRKNRLEHDKRGDLLRITAYYNELKN
jgi:hypothetical protein